MNDAERELAAIVERLRVAAAESGMSLAEIGAAMGYSPKSARQAVSRLLNPAAKNDPRLSTLLAFARAIGASLGEII